MYLSFKNVHAIIFNFKKILKKYDLKRMKGLRIVIISTPIKRGELVTLTLRNEV